MYISKKKNKNKQFYVSIGKNQKKNNAATGVELKQIAWQYSRLPLIYVIIFLTCSEVMLVGNLLKAKRHRHSDKHR
jgi:low temperature requirement protein LtrA